MVLGGIVITLLVKFLMTDGLRDLCFPGLISLCCTSGCLLGCFVPICCFGFR